MQHSLNVEQGNISLEKIQRNPRHLCACATLGAWPVWEDIVTFWDGWWERVTHLSLLLGGSNYMLHVAEKFWKQQLSGTCHWKVWMYWIQTQVLCHSTLRKYHWLKWHICACCYMSLKSFESNNYPVPHLAEEKIEWSECSFIFWENIIGESESYTSLLLGGNNYPLHVAEKLWKQQLSATCCWNNFSLILWLYSADVGNNWISCACDLCGEEF